MNSSDVYSPTFHKATFQTIRQPRRENVSPKRECPNWVSPASQSKALSHSSEGKHEPSPGRVPLPFISLKPTKTTGGSKGNRNKKHFPCENTAPEHHLQ